MRKAVRKSIRCPICGQRRGLAKYVQRQKLGGQDGQIKLIDTVYEKCDPCGVAFKDKRVVTR